ncbi:MAG: glycosyltransferase family 2 protein [Desulfomonile tiedjei]|nr:glycosyltransferase family 2 protein [Desulfomonile tiedjei]
MISIVVPVYNEQESLPELFRRLGASAETWGEPFEVLLVDDGSADASWEGIRALNAQDPRWKAVRLGRNFGHQAAISAGIHFAGGDCVVVMDGDLQDSPEDIGHFIEKWREGYHVVYAVRTRRKESSAKKAAYKVFYRMLAALSYVHMPLDAGDFGLMDRKVVDILKSMPERNRFVRGLRSWVGFKQIGIPHERQARAAGEVKYTYWKLLKLAVDGIFSFSAIPLRLATFLGIGTSILSIIAAVFYLLTRLFPAFFQGIGFPMVPGFASLIIAVFFLGGVQLTCLGIVGEYIARIYDEVKARPLWTTMEVLGIVDEAAGKDGPSKPGSQRICG